MGEVYKLKRVPKFTAGKILEEKRFANVTSDKWSLSSSSTEIKIKQVWKAEISSNKKSEVDVLIPATQEVHHLSPSRTVSYLIGERR